MIYELLQKGAENARSARELARVLHVDPHNISHIVERERRAGREICATCRTARPGYYLARNRAEMERYCNQLKHRAGEIHKTRAACLKTAQHMED